MKSFIVDSHMHTGPPGVFFTPKYSLEHYVSLMDKCQIQYAVCSHLPLVIEGNWLDTDSADKAFQQSQGRIYSLCTYNPNAAKESLKAMGKMCKSPAVVGMKIHPSWHGVQGSSNKYDPAWQFAADNDLTVLTHSWSISDYNPAQKLSTPGQFEKFVDAFPRVRFVLGHCGGKETGRLEAIRMINEYQNVYADFAGDLFDCQLIETLIEAVPCDKILFGSDFSWFDPRCNITRVLLADISDEQKLSILRLNALAVYKLGR